MFQKISNRMDLPQWALEGSRWRKLIVLDKLLDGTFYDHLRFGFYDEQTGSGAGARPIALEERRPSTQYRLPRYVARWAARKLFAGRHAPKIRSQQGKATEKRVQTLLSNTRIWQTMFEAAYRGSVGSVAITFRVAGDRVGLKVWRAVWCSPQFDDFGELATLQVHYVTSAAELAAQGILVPDPQYSYWFIRDYGPEDEVTYAPVKADDWNPAEGFRDPERKLEPLGEPLHHGLGFIPAVWIANPGGNTVDGCALWEDAIPNSIEIDYLLSQAARGARYNCAPQLVTQGDLKNGEEVTRGPTTYLAFDTERKDTESGYVQGAGDAKLLEMTGSGADAALKIVEQLKKMALEQIGVVHKDPSEMPGPLSGRAMEYIDDDAHDVAMQWRTTYGDGGALPLICKLMRVLDSEIDVSGLWLQWPRIYQPTPDDMMSMVTALKQASTPAEIGGGAQGGAVTVVPALMDPAKAQAYLEANLDLGILDDTADGPAAGPAGSDPQPEGDGAPHGESPIQTIGPFWRIFAPTRV